MRETVYYPGYGYVTKDDEFEYSGNGIIDDGISFIKGLITSDAAKNLASETAKSFANTAGKKAGEKAAEKLVDKVFSKKSFKNVEVVDYVVDKVVDEVIDDKKVALKKKKDVLARIYGDGLFRQSGKGLRRV